MNHVIFKSGATAVISRVKPQPYIDEYNNLKQGNIIYGQKMNGQPNFTRFCERAAPYRIGDKVAVKEELNKLPILVYASKGVCFEEDINNAAILFQTPPTELFAAVHAGITFLNEQK